MAQTVQEKEIECVLQLSPEQYEVYKTMAKLRGMDLQTYIYDQIVNCVPSLIDATIPDYKEQKELEKAWDRTQVTMTCDRTIILHCFLDAPPKQRRVIERVMEAEGLEGMVHSMTLGDMDHLGHFEAAKDMEQTLKED